MRALTALLLAASAVPAAAQSEAHRFQAGVAAGAGYVSRGEGGGSDLSPTLGVQLGVALGGGTILLLDVSRFGTLDDEPRTTDITPGGAVLREPDVFESTTVELGVEVPVGGGFYLRPSLGLGQHALATYRVDGSSVVDAGISHEAGLAAGAALGRVLRVGRTRLGVEALGTWSGGEDSSAARTLLAVRVVPRWGF